jgi:hypothetical protein
LFGKVHYSFYLVLKIQTSYGPGTARMMFA